MTDDTREAFRQLIQASAVLDRETIGGETPAARGVQHHLQHHFMEFLIAVDIWAAEVTSADPSA